jgi:pSer/pThr/pTyr-binding forkhead associated (FHA) protein
MDTLYCINCEENVSVSNISSPECPKCWGDDFKEAEASTINNTANEGRVVESIEFIYQSNFEKIILVFFNHIQTIGRDSVGSEMLSKIMVNNRPVISRKHCEIEFKPDENSFFVQDLNSTNGTFVDEKEASTAILLKDQSILKLGREVFVASFIYGEQVNNEEDSAKISTNDEVKVAIPNVFYCPDCSSNYDNDGYCPECDVKLQKT